MPKKKGGALVPAGKEGKLAKVNYEEEMAKLAKQAAESETLPAGNFASLKNGLLIGGNRMKDDKADVVILGSVLENDYYPGKYDAEEKNPPTCFAFGQKEEEMRPAANALGYWDGKAFVKPDSCVGCPMNEWGSAKQGRGKGCQNRRRLAFISANGVEDSDFVETAEVVQIKIPVTSVRAWKGYVHQVSENGLHFSYVVTTISRLPDDKTMLKVNFGMGAALAPELLPVITARREEVGKLIVAPYPTVEEDEGIAMATGKAPKGTGTAAKAKKAAGKF